MNKKTLSLLIVPAVVLLLVNQSFSSGFSFWKKGVPELKPHNHTIEIPLSDIDDGQAHHFNVQSSNGLMVTFFTLKSKDGVIRSAIDACDVCYRSGKGYKQDGDFMVCQNCGQRFASNKINVVKGGCNPAPLKRTISSNKLVIAMSDIDANSWYMKYRK